MSDHEIVFGTPEHIAGLSREALEEDFRWVNDRRMELEGECERLASENAKLRELVGDMWTYITEPVGKRNNLKERLARLDDIGDRMRELGVEVTDG